MLHYLYLVVFMWMLVEGAILLQKTMKSINKPPKFIPIAALALSEYIESLSVSLTRDYSIIGTSVITQ